MQKDNTTAHNASEYDAQIIKTIPYHEQFHKETINFVKARGQTPQTWLDTGCGTGVLVHRCLQSFPETKFLLSDPSEAMLALAKQRLADFGERVSFLPPAVTQALPASLSPAPDVITAIQAHHYLQPEQREEATKKCLSLLREGGVFITFENVSPTTPEGIETGKRYWGSFQTASGKTQEQAQKHLARFGTEYFPITVEEHLALYRRCGFKTVELLWYSYMQAGFYCIK